MKRHYYYEIFFMVTHGDNMSAYFDVIKMRRQEQCETRTTRMLSHLSSDEEYYTADEETNDIYQQLSPVYPNYIQFIVGYISPWPENLSRSNCAKLYHEYLIWCKTNNKKPLRNTTLGKKLSEIGICRIQVRIMDGKREWQYILDRSKIMNKIHQLFGSP